MTLHRYRTVPSTPCSLVKPACRLAWLSTGFSNPTPTSDQVPLDVGQVRALVVRAVPG